MAPRHACKDFIFGAQRQRQLIAAAANWDRRRRELPIAEARLLWLSAPTMKRRVAQGFADLWIAYASIKTGLMARSRSDAKGCRVMIHHCAKLARRIGVSGACCVLFPIAILSLWIWMQAALRMEARSSLTGAVMPALTRFRAEWTELIFSMISNRHEMRICPRDP
jgi:hypothetical protein